LWLELGFSSLMKGYFCLKLAKDSYLGGVAWGECYNDALASENLDLVVLAYF
jgi:hypothetical protein